jgi:hypothetical protein
MNKTIERLLKTGGTIEKQPPATAESISKVEKALNAVLPAAYREWLGFSNGGEIFVPGTIFYGTDGNNSLANNNTSKLREQFSIPKNLVIIGQMNFGDFVCADLNTQQIVQWSHDDGEEFLRWDNFYIFLDNEISDYIKMERNNV